MQKDPRDILFFIELLQLVKNLESSSAETAVVIIDNFDAPVLRELNRTRSSHKAKDLMSFFNQMLYIVEFQPSDEPHGVIKIILTGTHYPIGMRAAYLSDFASIGIRRAVTVPKNRALTSNPPFQFHVEENPPHVVKTTS